MIIQGQPISRIESRRRRFHKQERVERVVLRVTSVPGSVFRDAHRDSRFGGCGKQQGKQQDYVVAAKTAS